jgi:SynChlorMet cassette protein ScmD
MTDDKKPKVNPTVVLREEFDDWAILFNPDTKATLGINPMGVYVWKCLDGKHTINEILEDVKENCDSVPDDAENHLKDFIDDLIQRGLAEWETEKSNA